MCTVGIDEVLPLDDDTDDDSSDDDSTYEDGPSITHEITTGTNFHCINCKKIIIEYHNAIVMDVYAI